MTTIPVAKVYLRSIVFILASVTGIVAYGIYVEPVGEQVLLAMLGTGAAVVVFDKPKIEAVEDDD